MDKILELKKCIKSLSYDAEKFFIKKNNAAGVRVRKKLQECKKISQEIRNLVQNIKFKFVQKKAKIKAAQAAYFGKNILTSQKFLLKCLKDDKLEYPKTHNITISQARKKNYVTDLQQRNLNNYELENFFDYKPIVPASSYDLLN